MNPTKMIAVGPPRGGGAAARLPLATFAAEQKTFATPEAAVDALMAALKADDDAAIVALFGDEYKDLVDHARIAPPIPPRARRSSRRCRRCACWTSAAPTGA